jgi:hypothetical protein
LPVLARTSAVRLFAVRALVLAMVSAPVPV